MKKILLAGLSLMIAFHTFADNTSNIDERVTRAFNKSFPAAENVHWYEDKNEYVVSFVEKDILTRITYDKKGKFVSEMRNYSAQLLPFYLVNLLKEKYPDQEIFGVTEITSNANVNYYVKLEGTKFWTTVRLDNDGTATVVERYRKL